MYCCQLITTVTALLCVLHVQGVAAEVHIPPGYNLTCNPDQNVDLRGGMLDNLYIQVPYNLECSVNVHIVNIPLHSWIGFVARQFNLNGSLAIGIGDSIAIGATFSANLPGGKSRNNTLLYRKYTSVAENITISLALGRHIQSVHTYRYKIEIILAGVIHDNQGQSWVDPDGQSGHLVSHQTFDLDTTYDSGLSTGLTLTNNISQAMDLSFLFWDVHWSKLFKWFICDDYLRITGIMDEFRLCGWGDLKKVRIYPRQGEISLNFFTSEEDYATSVAEGFLIKYNAVVDPVCPPQVSNSVTSPGTTGNTWLIECDSGYAKRDGSTTQTVDCSQDHWTFSHCYALKCTLPSNWDSSNVDVQSISAEGSDTLVGYVAMFSCVDDSYVLTPPNTRSECLSNQTWSHQFPECPPKPTTTSSTTTTPTTTLPATTPTSPHTSPHTSAVLTDGSALGDTSSTKLNSVATTNRQTDISRDTLIGTAVGSAFGVLLIAIIIFLVIIQYRRSKKESRKSEPNNAVGMGPIRDSDPYLDPDSPYLYLPESEYMAMGSPSYPAPTPSKGQGSFDNRSYEPNNVAANDTDCNGYAVPKGGAASNFLRRQAACDDHETLEGAVGRPYTEVEENVYNYVEEENVYEKVEPGDGCK